MADKQGEAKGKANLRLSIIDIGINRDNMVSIRVKGVGTMQMDPEQAHELGTLLCDIAIQAGRQAHLADLAGMIKQAIRESRERGDPGLDELEDLFKEKEKDDDGKDN